MTKGDDGLTSLFFKISKRLKMDFDEAIKASSSESKINRTQVLEKLIEHFIDLPSEQRLKLFKGESLGYDPANVLVNYISSLQMSEHWFQSKFWMPAIESYEHLFNNSKDYPIVQNWTRYKLGYAWLEIAYERRLECVSLLARSNFDKASEEQELAIQSVNKSIEFTLGAYESGILSPMSLIVLFNLACAYSLRCHFGVEQILLGREYDNKLEDVEELRQRLVGKAKEKMENDLKKKSTENHHMVAVEAFNEIYKKEPSGSLSDSIRALCNLSFKYLEEIYTKLNNQDENINISWLIQRMYTDIDLGFIRDVHFMKDQFEQLRIRLANRETSAKDWCNDKLGDPLGRSKE